MRYWLFAYDDYHPYGGFHDFVAASDTTQELKARVTLDESGKKMLLITHGDNSLTAKRDNAAIVDVQERRIICEACVGRKDVCIDWTVP